MPFIARHRPPRSVDGPSWWFAYSGDKILIETAKDHVRPPLVSDLGAFRLRPLRAIYLGELDGTSCMAADIGPDFEMPAGLTLSSLRRLFGTLDENLFWVAGRAFQAVDFERTHQWCGQCGGPTQDKDSEEERAKICPRCGLAVFPRMSPAIIVAIRREKQILLARAKRFPEAFYSVIAGFVAQGESLEECVRREVMEEVGVEVTDIRYFGSQSWPFPNSLMVGFTANYSGGEIRIDPAEIVDARWFTAADLPRIPDKISIARRLIDWFVEESGRQ